MNEVNDKNEMLREFEIKYVKDRYKAELPKIIKKYNENKEKIKENLISQFAYVCKEAILCQENGVKGEIKYIYFSMLRTKLLENKGQWRIDLYDEKWFLDRKESYVYIDLDFIYDPLFLHIKELSEKKKEYLYIKKVNGLTNNFKIKEKDLEAIKLKEANKYHSIALKVIRNSLKDFLNSNEYKKMKKSEDITIMAGEYMDAAIQINLKSHNKKA